MKRTEKHKKSFDWYGLSQRFSIRKLHFGAASVLLGTTLLMGGTASAEEIVDASLASQSEVAQVVTEEEVPAVEQVETVEETVETPATEATVAPAAEASEKVVAETEVAEVSSATSVDAPAEEVVATATPSPVATPVTTTRTASVAIKVVYVDESGSSLGVSEPSYRATKESSLPVSEKEVFDVSIALTNIPAGTTVLSAETASGQALSVLNNAIEVAVVEGASSQDRTFRITVRKDNVASASATPVLGGTMLRSATTSSSRNVNDLVTATTKFQVYGPGANLNPPVSQETNGGGVKIVSSFKVDDSVIAGDYFTVQMGRNINYVGASDIRTASGEVAAKLSYDAATETLTYTFTDYVDRLYNVSGSFTIITDPEFDKVTTDKQSYPVSVTVAGETATDNIIYDYGNDAPISSVIRDGRIITYVNADLASALTYGSYTNVTIDSHGSTFTNRNQVTVYEIPNNYIAPDSYEVDLSKLRKVSKTTRIENGNAIIQLSGLIQTRSTNRYVIISTPSGTTTGATATVLGNRAGFQHGVGVKVVRPESSIVGELPAPKTYSIGDTIWVDINKDGIQNEIGAGKSGVTVNLLDANGRQIQTTITDASGKYKFSELTNGTYFVEVIPPAGYLMTQANVGDDSQDSDFVADSAGRYRVAVSVNDADNMTIDGGLIKDIRGNVTVEHVSDTGEVLIATAPVKTNVPVGEDYTTSNRGRITTPDGRVFTYLKVAEDSAPVSGKVAEQPQHVKYVYTQVKGNVTVEHVSDTGEVLIATAPVKTNAPVGEAYSTRNEELIRTPDGRVFIYLKVAADSAPVSGKVTEQLQHIKYVYTLVDNDYDRDSIEDE